MLPSYIVGAVLVTMYVSFLLFVCCFLGVIHVALACPPRSAPYSLGLSVSAAPNTYHALRVFLVRINSAWFTRGSTGNLQDVPHGQPS